MCVCVWVPGCQLCFLFSAAAITSLGMLPPSHGPRAMASVAPFWWKQPTHSDGGRLIDTHNCRPCCSCDKDRLRGGLHGIITFGVTGPLPPQRYSTQTVPLSPCAVRNFQVKEPHPTSPALVGVGRSVARPGLREGRHATPFFHTHHVSVHGTSLYHMHRQPCLRLGCAFDLRGPGKLNSSSHDAARRPDGRGMDG